MTEKSTEEIKVDSPRKPLEPVGDGVSEEQRTAYAKLLAEYERIKGVHDTQIRGVSVIIDTEKEPRTIEAYNVELSLYRKARSEYNRRFADSIETIDMVRANIYRMCEEDEQYEKDHPDVECPEVPELEDVPDEPWEDFKKRLEKFSRNFQAWNERSQKNSEKRSCILRRFLVRMEETCKFPQLEYELEMRLRYTYIDPKTGEYLYRPNDDVGEGLICVGSRDYTPVLRSMRSLATM